MRKVFAAFVRWSGLGSLIRAAVARRGVTIIVYHDPAPDVLEKHLRWLARRYTFITMDAVADALESGAWDRLPPHPLVVTFDDGHRGNLRLAPVLRAFDVRPTIYLCSRIIGTHRPYWWQTPAARRLGVQALKAIPDVERRRRLAAAGDDPDRDGPERQAMSWAEARDLLPVCDFGAHTRTHPILPRCDDRRSAEEIIVGKSEVEAFLQRPCPHFAYPNGDYGERELAALRRAGYRTARTIEAGWNGPGVDPMRLRAFPVSDDATVSVLGAQMTGLPAWRRSRKNRRRQAAPATGDRPLPAA